MNSSPTFYKSKKSFALASRLMLISWLSGCGGCHCGEWLKVKSEFPEIVQNMKDANSIYDDMNLVPPEIVECSYFYFSSNRNSQGKNFDIVSVNFVSLFDRKSREYRSASSVDGNAINNPKMDKASVYHIFQISKLLPEVNTEKYNELGPYGYSKKSIHEKHFKYYLLYSNDDSKTGDLNVKFAYIEGRYEYPTWYPTPPSILSLKGNFSAALLNSNSDDAYPSIDDVNGLIYFCSNRSGKFQLYQVKYDPSKDLIDELQSAKNIPEIIPSLASAANDKCPFVKNNVMVFVSDRAGGMGGFDLYYSLRGANGVWSAPVNFGANINTSSDEYRPIIDKFDDFFMDGERAGGFSNNLLMFSSNRPGGLGGYDLYFVGVPKLISE